jgi:hypothetical protein
MTHTTKRRAGSGRPSIRRSKSVLVDRPRPGTQLDLSRVSLGHRLNRYFKAVPTWRPTRRKPGVFRVDADIYQAEQFRDGAWRLFVRFLNYNPPNPHSPDEPDSIVITEISAAEARRLIRNQRRREKRRQA